MVQWSVEGVPSPKFSEHMLRLLEFGSVHQVEAAYQSWRVVSVQVAVQ